MREDGDPVLTVVVRLAAALREHAGGAAEVEVDVPAPATVAAVIDAVAAVHPSVGRRVRDEAGVLRRHVNVFVGADNARDLGGVDAVVPDGVEVTVLPAVSGGS
ncbi:MAG TPA: ubiquitin-like small modifier protein 1 [Acidimicrobiales bacterium]|nr:ubiquitin-like small modifier protein 1 [Acidimicrobiales bacterium]